MAKLFICELRHGIKLEAEAASGRLKVQAVGDFLAQAMRHFKHHRDVLKTGVYAEGPFSVTVPTGRGKKATLTLAQDADQEPLTAALWTEAVIAAYTVVNTVEQMAEDLVAWKAAVAREGQSPFLREVVNLLDKPGGDIQGMQMMLKDSTEKAMKEGSYKPGEVTPF